MYWMYYGYTMGLTGWMAYAHTVLMDKNMAFTMEGYRTYPRSHLAKDGLYSEGAGRHGLFTTGRYPHSTRSLFFPAFRLDLFCRSCPLCLEEELWRMKWNFFDVFFWLGRIVFLVRILE